MMSDFLERLRACIGPAHVLTEAADIESFCTDWRGRYHGSALAVARPGTTEEVARVVLLAADARIPVVPQGGNTGMMGGATPSEDRSQLVVSLGRMNRVRRLDRDNATLTVEAGLTLAEVQNAAREAGMMFPLSLGSEGSCQIGGNLSTNAGGTAVLRYGNTRELVLGIEVVLPDGRVWDGLRGLRKDNTGYDLKQLFIGAEGTLGIITAAVLKLFPQPRSSVTALAAVGDPPAAVALLRLLRGRLGDRLTGFELISEVCTRLVQKHIPRTPDLLPGHPWYCLLQVDEPWPNAGLVTEVEAALAEAAQSGVAIDAVIAQSLKQAADMWRLRENISEAQRMEGPGIKHDISLPVSAIPQFLEQAGTSIQAALPGVRIVAFGHLGDGNLHYNLSRSDSADNDAVSARSKEITRIVHDLVHRYGGSISAEHGLGQSKRDEIKRYKDPLELDLMRRVKRAFDPHNLFNPGKVLDLS
jgi:FAD/FMN-containing dehydrogenase